MTLNAVTSLLLALLVLLAGNLVNARVPVLSRHNIPDPITGGLLFSLLASLLVVTTEFRLAIDATIKPLLLLAFFAGTGMTADLRHLRRGGKALALFLAVLVPFILLQNLAGIAGAVLMDLPPILGLVAGSMTLVGGHGTGAAYAERFAEIFNLQSVMELSMTAATLGLILGGVLGGPVAQYLIDRNRLRGPTAPVADGPVESAPPADRPLRTIDMIGSLAGVFAALAIGRWLSEHLSGGALTIPAFLCCMVVGVALRNLLPLVGVRPDDRASELVAGICLALFLVMTMMTIDLVEAATAAAPVLLIAAMQGVLACVYAAFVCFRVMGRDYEAAVTTAAFVGFSVGSTATAMVNMKALVGRYGPAPTAMLIVPLAGAFFVDLANALILTALLAWPLLGG